MIFKDLHLSTEEVQLGMASGITRRDFIGVSLAGAGALLLGVPAPLFAKEKTAHTVHADGAWFNGFGGVGDYANANGNTWEVLSSAHQVRDGSYDDASGLSIKDTGEVYDLAIVGGGAAGLGSAYHFTKATSDSRKCVIFDNHAIFGGEAKRNEFEINGVRLFAPQASNLFLTPSGPGEGFLYDTLVDIGMPLEYGYAALSGTEKKLDFDRTNFAFYWPPLDSDSIGFFSESKNGGDFVHNAWENQLKGLPYSQNIRNDLLRWRNEVRLPENVPNIDHWLDSMSYEDYLLKVHNLSTEVPRFCDKLVASGFGLGAANCSAYGLSRTTFPGFRGLPDYKLQSYFDNTGKIKVNGFPGGNAYVARFFVKHLIPSAIEGEKRPEDIVQGRVQFDALDRPENRTRIRLGSTVVRVEHEGNPERAQHVRIVYEHDGNLYSVKARTVIMASGGWITRKVVRDLPSSYLEAFRTFRHAPILCANVALTNWRFMERAGITACMWSGGDFGFQCNIRRPIKFGSYKPQLDPDQPIVLTFYVPFVYPGLSTTEQGAQGRYEILATSYREYEYRIRKQLMRMFSRYGFDPERDIGGIILNRWGHAYVVPEPGFYFGKNGRPAARDIVRQSFGRIAFAHSELKGFQTFRGAVQEGERAVAQIADLI